MISSFQWQHFTNSKTQLPSKPNEQNSLLAYQAYLSALAQTQNQNQFSRHFFNLAQQKWLNELQMMNQLRMNEHILQQIKKKVNQMNVELDLLKFQVFDKDAAQKQDPQSSDDESLKESVSCCQKNYKKINYKIVFLQRIFGVKSYQYKLSLANNFPTILYKQRNVSIKVQLLNLKKRDLVQNRNALTLNLKVYYSTGQQVAQTKKGDNFIKGSTNQLLINGLSVFEKIYPRQVSKKLKRQKLCIVIYPSSLGNNTYQNQSAINPAEIEPLVIYGVKVITKQNQQQRDKKIKSLKSKFSTSNDSESQFKV